MNFLVTGGAGFIGSHVIEKLLTDNHSVVCVDNFDDFYDPSVKRRNLSEASSRDGFRLVEGDIRDQSVLDQCFSGDPVDAVIHLAARAGVRPSLLQPELYYDVNVIGTLRILEMMRKHDVSRMFFASSSSVYGNNSKTPFSETDSVDNPISPYAASKKAGELLCHTYHHLYGFDIHCVRFFTVYGPRQRPEMAIHNFVKRIMNEEPIIMYGDGTSQRDYTYIEDILDGIMKSLAHLKGYEIINLGESRTTALSKLVATIENAVEKKAVIQRQPMQPGDVQVTFADITKAKRMLGYQPRCSVEYGVEKFIDWFQKTNHT